MTRGAFVASLRSYLGVPFWHCGRSRAGVDCVGLPVCAARDLGVAIYDEDRYTQDIDAGRLRAGIERSCRPVALAAAQAGDVLLFRARDGNAQHVAVLTSATTMIHAWDSAGFVAEHDFNDGWRRQLAAVYRWEGF